jgi:tetratricopeptide (TPR) repeat protein
MSTEQLRPTPYKGLEPFSEKDSLFFFGREALRDMIISSLISSRLTVIYGASGVGKSSIVHAGVAHKLKRLARTARHEGGAAAFAIAFSHWQGDPIKALADRVRKFISQDTGIELSMPARALKESFRAWEEELRTKEWDAELIILLDQFEDYFLYHDEGKGTGTFISEISQLVNSTDLRVNFLISIRDDAYTKLDCFKDEISNLFDDSIRIPPLQRDEARAAINGPLERYNSFYAAGRKRIFIEPELIEAVLEQVETDKVSLADAGGGGGARTKAAGSHDAGIETPFLQLVMKRLWEEEMASGSNTLRLSTLNHLAKGRMNGAQSIAREHLLSAMNALTEDEKDVASRIFYRLVTPSRKKIACTNYDLAESEGLDQVQLAPVLEKLLAGSNRILRVSLSPDQKSEPQYEIFHDVLVSAILEWRRRHVAERKERKAQAEAARKIEEQARIARVRLVVALVLAAALLLALGAATWAIFERRQAVAARRNMDIASLTNNLIAVELNDFISEEELKGLLKNLEQKVDDQGGGPDALRDALFLTQMAVVSRLMGQTSKNDGKYSEALNHYSKAEDYVKRALENFQGIFRKEDSSYIAVTLNELAVIDYEQGKLAEAEPPLSKAVAIMEKLWEPKDEKLLLYIDNLAACSDLLGKYEQAERLYRRALDIRQNRWPSDSPLVAEGLKNLADVYFNQEKYDEARSLYEQARTIVEQASGKDSYEVAQYLNGLAQVDREKQMYAESDLLFRKELALDLANEGEESFTVAYDYNDLGQLYSEWGKYAEAETFLKRALAKLGNAIGVDSIVGAAARRNLAITFYKQKKYTEAEQLFKDALAIEEKTLGSDSYAIAKTLEGYAALLEEVNRTAEAEQEKGRAEAIRRKLRVASQK